MIIPCIDLMDGKVVQLRQGREKVLEGKSPQEMVEMFAGFPWIQVIDLDAAFGKGSNAETVKYLASNSAIRAGGGVRSTQRATELLAQGAAKVIVGTAAFLTDGPNRRFLWELSETVGAERIILALDSKDGRVVVKGWQESTNWTASEILRDLEPYCSGFLCTYVDKEGMMQGTDLEWFRTLRSSTGHEITAAGGITTMDDIRALTALGIHCAVGMSIYTGFLKLDELRAFNTAIA
ncbi:MAG: 1-(5-phosphoribosyl)-5-[(5-phosphoribosylamino)methylideneamino] imidazole-4-carboxamide isomerase [Acidobacteriaceae bacterium]|nr:1-(5-phosphoribosyl)-5-[(5-phosphoribosylamino)methylideneamino] imidazole-4-carboxamide isomerase [Acidobacteriaceae bacterium]